MTSGAKSLDFLTRRHGVKIVSKASVEDCSLAVGEVVGCENVMSASRMNNAELPATSDAVGQNSAETSKDVNPTDSSGVAAASKQMGGEGLTVMAMDEAPVVSKTQSTDGLGDVQNSD
ncbi:Chaperone protein DnaK [Labeo rohita]|uniref:Chaperone protein DnaK n=1 Tax=Labeo rohita TaxID=84645 RepID=A0ABQ8L8T3_LABRO|nr:Chaperone protein DnaK [Labeo rohita]